MSVLNQVLRDLERRGVSAETTPAQEPAILPPTPVLRPVPAPEAPSSQWLRIVVWTGMALAVTGTAVGYTLYAMHLRESARPPQPLGLRQFAAVASLAPPAPPAVGTAADATTVAPAATGPAEPPAAGGTAMTAATTTPAARAAAIAGPVATATPHGVRSAGPVAPVIQGQRVAGSVSAASPTRAMPPVAPAAARTQGQRAAISNGPEVPRPASRAATRAAPTATIARDAAAPAMTPQPAAAAPAAKKAPAGQAAASDRFDEVQSGIAAAGPMPAAPVPAMAAAPRAPAEHAGASAAPPSPPAIVSRSVPPAAALEARAFELAARGRAVEAMALLGQTLARAPASGSARAALAALQAESGRRDLALQTLLAGVDVEPGRFAAVAARLQAELGDAAGALATLDRMPEAARDAAYHALAGGVAQRAGDHSRAAAAYREALREASAPAVWWAGLAISLEAQHRTGPALDAYRRAAAGTLPAATLRFVLGRISALTAIAAADRAAAGAVAAARAE
jgi:tetratricopeptide (TPR) repeat protein